MSIIEQVERLQKDMEVLLDDLYNTDSDNIDFEQLKKLSSYSKNYSIDINMVRSYIENYHCRYINIYQAKKAKGFGLSIAESELICKTKNNIIVMLNPFNISIGKCEVTRNVNVN